MSAFKEQPSRKNTPDTLTRDDDTPSQQHPQQSNGPSAVELGERLRQWVAHYEWDKLGAATHRLNFHKWFVKEIHALAVQKEAGGQKLLAARLVDQCHTVGHLCAKIDQMIRKGCQTEDELDYLEVLKSNAQQAVLELAQTTGLPVSKPDKHPACRRRLRAVSSTLSAQEQRVWALVHVQGKTVAQAAMEMSCSRQNISGSSGKWIDGLPKKRHRFMIGGKNITPLLEYKAMSNSLLYHTFGIRSVQHRNTVFLAARRYFSVGCTPTP